MKLKLQRIILVLAGTLIFHGGVRLLLAEETASPPQGETGSPSQGTMPFSTEPDTHQRSEKRIFPLMGDKARERGRELPPPFGVMYITNWMDSDWKFDSAAVSVGNLTPVPIDAAQNATMDLQVNTNGVKADLWVLPFLDLMIGGGKVDVDALLGLRDIPVGANIAGTVKGDAIVPMKFGGDYYSFGGVLAGAYKRLYVASDFNWLKTKLQGDASLSSDGFWTFTAAPKFGYNAGLSQVYIGARFISKNEHFQGTVPLPSGDNLGFDVRVRTNSWAGNFGIRTVIRKHWELLMESSVGHRYQITGGLGYRW